MSSKSWTGIWANKQIKYSILICCRHSFNRHEFNGSRSSTPIRFRFGFWFWFWFDVVKCKCSFNCNDMNEILLCISSNSHKFHKSKCFSMTIIHSTHTHAHAQPKDTHLIQGYECFALQSYQIQRTHTHTQRADHGFNLLLSRGTEPMYNAYSTWHSNFQNISNDKIHFIDELLIM